MSTLTPQTALQMKATAALALVSVLLQSDDQKYITIRTAYDQVRTLQGGTEETDHSETPRAAMEEYLQTSLDNVNLILEEMEKVTISMDIVPDPMTDGIVFVPTGGSGS